MEKVYLKAGAEDAKGKTLDPRTAYTLVASGKFFSVITNGYKTYFVNNKYIKD